MKTFMLLFVWFVIVLLDWLLVVVMTVVHKENATEQQIAIGNKIYLYIKTIGYILAVTISLLIGYLLK